MAIMKRLSLLASAAAMSAALAISGPAKAETLTYQGSNVFNGGGVATTTVNVVDVDDNSEIPVVDDNSFGPRTVNAGGFRLNDGTNNLIAWCLDILDTLENNQVYTTTTNPFDDYSLGETRIDNIQKLFNTSYSGVDLTGGSGLSTGDVQSAAFQLALWEIVFEAADQTDFDVASGNFYVTNTNASIIQQANEYLQGLDGQNTGNYLLTFWESQSFGTGASDKQDLVSAAAIPLPPAILMLLSGLLGLGFLSRRRSKMG
jgi:hypothetical protein